MTKAPWMASSKWPAKSFEDIQIGDPAYDCNVGDYQGAVLAKGSFTELEAAGYSTQYSSQDFLDDDWTQKEIDNLECVVISQNPSDTMEGFHNYIYLYDFDPCSVACKEERP